MKKVLLYFLIVIVALYSCNYYEKNKEKVLKTQLAKPKLWRVITIPPPHNIVLTLQTSWREGKLYYILTATPPNKIDAKRSYYSKFEINMLDKSGFNLFELDVPLSSMSRVVDEKGKPSHFEQNNSYACTAEMYEDFTDWSVKWFF